MLILRESDIAPILKGVTENECRKLLRALSQALQSYSAQNKSQASNTPSLIHQPMREHIRTHHDNLTLFMPASDSEKTTGIKVVTLPGHSGPPKGSINIFSPTGDLDGVLNAETLTAFRTALTTMIPFLNYRHPCDAHIVVFGAGKQAEWHIRLALLLLGYAISKVTVVNRSGKGLENLRRELDADVRTKYPKISMDYLARDSQDFTTNQLKKLVSEADAIFCCTPSTEPLFTSEYLGPNPVFISLIGSYKPHMQEIDSETLLSADGIVIVDSRDACLAEAGELIMADVSGDQLLEIGELAADRNLSMETFAMDNSVIFKCVGLGIMDVVLGRELLSLANGRGVGVTVDDF